jgi:predicted nucleic acid-binding protein
VNKALLDTDILSEVLKGIDPNVVRNATAYRAAFGRYTVSVISVMEIVRGLHKKGGRRRLQRFLAALASEEVLPLDQPAAELAGRIAGELDGVGQPIGRADPMIAAIALDRALELVTGNTAHFQRIQQLGYPLTLVNWRKCFGNGPVVRAPASGAA